MRTEKDMEQATTSTEEKSSRRPGRRTMTAEEKAAAAKTRATEKEKANNLKPELYVQYQGGEVDMASLVDAAKADFHKSKKRTLVTSMKIYFKPEESAAYYVINERFEGKINI